MEKKDTCVYFLRDPRDMVARYVGITTNPRARMGVHMCHSLSCRVFTSMHPRTADRYRWFQELHCCQLRPVMDVIFRQLSKRQAKSVEAFLLEKNRDAFYQAYTGRTNKIGLFSKLWNSLEPREREVVRQMVLCEEFAS